jgi:ubiquinone/menaquinone biosynthesis C-methylase UbiE
MDTQHTMILKTFFIEKIIEASGIKTPRILELACGTARHVRPLLESHPEYSYVGIEPYHASYSKAEAAIGHLPNVTLHNTLAYGQIDDIEENSFDIVFSLSALEHIKNLPSFISLGTRYAKPNGLVVHRYDLGHALYPGSLKERIQVLMGNIVPRLLSEHTFVRYVSESEVRSLLIDSGCRVERSTYHQMPSHRALEKSAREYVELQNAIHEMHEWEMKYASAFAQIDESKRELLFPTIAIWGRKEQINN